MSDLSLLYRIREALGFNQYYPLSHLDDNAKQQRTALLACASIAFAAIAEEKKNEIGNSDLDDEQPVTLHIRTTLGAVREARRALMVANLYPEAPKAPEPPKAPPPPVDRSQRVLTDGSPVTEDHREIKSNGQQKGYVVLSEAEHAKGFVRPVRRSYKHLKCGAVTTMGLSLAETYARDPFFYSGTFCATCCTHFPVGEDGEFVWDGTNEKVGI